MNKDPSFQQAPLFCCFTLFRPICTLLVAAHLQEQAFGVVELMYLWGEYYIYIHMCKPSQLENLQLPANDVALWVLLWLLGAGLSALYKLP